MQPEETSETSVSLPIKESESAVEAGEVHVRAIRKHPMLNLCVFLLGVVFLMAGCVGGVSLYKNWFNSTYRTVRFLRYYFSFICTNYFSSYGVHISVIKYKFLLWTEV